MLSKIRSYITSLLFPDLCVMCFVDEVAGPGNAFCMTCAVNMPYTDHFQRRNNDAVSKFWGRLPCEDIACMIYFYQHTDVRHMMHALKYKGRKDIGYKLGLRMGAKALHSDFFKNIDLIVPIPLHNMKLLSRGYNQSEWIAKGVSEILNIPIRTDVLSKDYNTKSQTQMGRIERVKNVYSSFRLLDPEGIRGRHILIIDDVLTTGATIEACGSRLLEARDVKISVMTACLARS